jgi:hypothetical protein
MPPLLDAERLYAIFLDQVDPVVRIIHKPTFLEEMKEYYLQIGHDSEIDRRSTAAFEALLFAVLFSALTSLSEQEQWDPSFLGQDTVPSQVKQGCLKALRLAIEQSLVRSEFLERPSLNSISACCLFLVRIEITSGHLLLACTNAPSCFSLLHVKRQMSHTITA